MAAQGIIIGESDIIAFLGTLNLAIQSQQDQTQTTINETTEQLAINNAEARCQAILRNGFLTPPTVNGVAIISANSSIAQPLLKVACCQYAGYYLNKWRAIQDVGGNPSSAAIDRIAAAWERDADLDIQKMVRYSQGYSDGLAVDLDMQPTAARLAMASGLPAPKAFRSPGEYGWPWPFRGW